MRERRCGAFGMKDSRGFTLVELILTIAILAVVTIPILSYFTDSAKHNARSRMKQDASVLAQDILENFKNSSYSLDDPAVVCSAQPDWSVDTAPNANGVYTLKQSKTIDDNLYSVKAQITPIKKIESTAAPSSKDYEKFVIGTMDSSKDVMSSEHGQTLVAAGLTFANKHSSACAAAGTTATVSAEEFQKKLNCTIVISAKQDTTKTGYDIITVKYRYTYSGSSYPKGIDASTQYEDIVESSSVKVESLENIYIFYTPLNMNDKIQLETDDGNAVQSDAGDLNLFVIAQSSVPANETTVPTGYKKRPAGYKLTIDGTASGFETKIKKLYLNLSKGDSELNSSGTIAGKAQVTSDGNHYTLVHSEKMNRMADIKVSIDSIGANAGRVVEVTGSKVQN